MQGEEQYIRRVTVGSERWSKINMEEQHCEDAKSLPEAQVEMVSDFLARWDISRMTEQDRQVTRPDIVLDVDHIAQTSNAREVQPAPAAFRLTAATATATDPRSSASTTYSTVFSGYVPGGFHTVSPPAVDAPWVSVSSSYEPYDLRTKHFLSLRVSSTLATVPTSSVTSSHARYTGAVVERCMATPTLPAPLSSVLTMLTPVKTCQPEGGDQLAHEGKGMPTAAAPRSSDSERNISPDITCQSQDGAGLERDSMTARTPTTAAPLFSDLERNISPVITCQSQDGAELELTVRPLARLQLPLLSPLIRRGTLRRLSHVSRKTELRSSATVRPLLLLLSLSQRESVITSDSPSLPAATYSGYAPAVKGDDTLSCSSSPHFSMIDLQHYQAPRDGFGARTKSGALSVAAVAVLGRDTIGRAASFRLDYHRGSRCHGAT